MTARTGAGTSRQWRNVDVVRERDDRGVRRLWVLLFGLVLALLPTAVYLLEQMQYVQARYRIEELRAERARLAEQQRRLRVERATLESFPEIERRAGRRLGLVQPAPERVVIVTRPARSPGDLVASGPSGASTAGPISGAPQERAPQGLDSR